MLFFVTTVHPFVLLNSIPVFIHFTVDEDVGCFQFLAVTKLVVTFVFMYTNAFLSHVNI